MKTKEIVVKKINLQNVEITNVDGKTTKVDFSKELANQIYFSTKDLGVAEAIRDLYKSGECDATDAVINEITQKAEQMYGVIVAQAIKNAIKG